MKIPFNLPKIWQAVIITILVTALLIAWWFVVKSASTGKTTDYLSEYTVKFLKSDPDVTARDSLISIIDAKNESDSAEYRNIMRVGKTIAEASDPMRTFEYLRNCISILNKYPDESAFADEFKANCYHLLGTTSANAGLLTLSHEYYFTGLKLVDKIDNDELRGDFFNNIGVNYYRAGKPEKAMEYYEKALEIGHRMNYKSLLDVVYSNISAMKGENNDFDGAIDYALKSIQCADERTNPQGYYMIQTMLGELYQLKGDRQMAFSYLTNAFQNLSKIKNKDYLFETCMSLISYYAATNTDPDSVLKYTEMATRLAEESKNHYRLIRVLESQRGLADASGDTEKAYALELRIAAMKDSTYRVENATRIEQANNIYNIEKESERLNSRMAGWDPAIVFYSMSILVAVLIAFFIWLTILRKRKEAAISEKADAVAKYAELQQALLREEHLKRKQMQHDLESHHRKLTSFTLERIRTNERVEEMSTEIKKLILGTSPRDKDRRQQLKDLLINLHSLKSDSQWEEFQYYFERVHPAFYKRLDEIHPGLTAKDRRLCALISLGLSSKDIASITFREVRSVESSRNRLRKKLCLGTDDNLFEYMLSLVKDIEPVREAEEAGASQPTEKELASLQ